MSRHRVPAHASPIVRLRIRSLAALVLPLVAATLITAVIPSANPWAAEDTLAPGISTPARPTEERPRITFKDGKLTVQLRDRPLAWVVQEISRGAKVAIVMADGVGDELISPQLRDLPVDEVLRQILGNYDAFFFYGVVQEAPAALKVVWVYPRGEGRRHAPEPAQTWASTKELVDQVEGPDAQGRARAVVTLIERKGNQARDVVLGALQDRDDDVRADALHAALKGDVSIPIDTLASLARSDPSPSVRFLALDGLARDPDAGAAVDLSVLATHALQDSSPHVREKAREILRRLRPASQRLPSDPGQRPYQQQGR